MMKLENGKVIEQGEPGSMGQDVVIGVKVEAVAEIAHEVNRAWCIINGDMSQVPWLQAPEWQRESARAGVKGILLGNITKPSESHESWLAEKERDGWKYGEVKDADKKEHPCFVPYDELPEVQRMKDHLYFNVVRNMLGLQ